jgi:YD repeat-containing protein
VYYLNQDGRMVNTVTPGGHTSTAEYDAKGNVVRELSPANRERALAAGGGSATLAGLLSTYSTYSADGLELVEELGPQHEVKLDSGQVADARAHVTTTYDEGYVGSTPPHLPTTVEAGAEISPSQVVDVRTTKTEYDWGLRLPTATVTDATQGGLNVRHETAYNAAGLEVSSSQPKSNGADAGTTTSTYYTHDGSSPDPDCRDRPEWFNLPCKVGPAAQPGTAGLPDLPVTTYEYNWYGQVTEATEQVGQVTRTSTTAYDAAGRTTSESLTTAGGGPGGEGPHGLVAAYGFDEGSGSAVADSSGEGNDGTVSGASWTEGRFGAALEFDGADDYVEIPDDDSLDLTDSFTVSAWVKLDELHGTWQQVLYKEHSGSGVYTLAADQPSNNEPRVSRSILVAAGMGSTGRTRSRTSGCIWPPRGTGGC